MNKWGEALHYSRISINVEGMIELENHLGWPTMVTVAGKNHQEMLKLMGRSLRAYLHNVNESFYMILN